MNTPTKPLTPLSKPIVTINGTTRAELVCEHMDISNALRNVSAMMGGRTPHDRDYQTVGGDAGPLARLAFEERKRILRDMAAEFEDIALQLSQEGRS